MTDVAGDTSLLLARQRRKEFGSGATPLGGHSSKARRGDTTGSTRSAALGFLLGTVVAAILVGSRWLVNHRPQQGSSAGEANDFEGSVGPVYTGQVSTV